MEKNLNLDGLIKQLNECSKSEPLILSKKGNSIKMWWEDKDKWFLNILYSRDKKPSWIVDSDVKDHLSYLLRLDYKVKE